VSAVAAVIGVPVAVVSMVAAHGDAQPPGVSPGARVEIIQPGVDSVMQANGDVPVAGTVTGLAGNQLWVIVRPDVDGSEPYYLAQSDPVVEHDGAWQFVSEPVGDKTDKDTLSPSSRFKQIVCVMMFYQVFPWTIMAVCHFRLFLMGA
jgi:hypothetical protein